MKHYIPLKIRYLLFSGGAGWLVLNALSRQDVRFLVDYQELLTNKVAAVGALILCFSAFMASDAAWKNSHRPMIPALPKGLLAEHPIAMIRIRQVKVVAASEQYITMSY